MMERLQQQAFLVEHDALGAFDVGDERGVRLDDVELAGAQPEDAHVRVGADLDADVELGLRRPSSPSLMSSVMFSSRFQVLNL